MARVGPLAGRDIDALWNALRPRILGLGTSGSTRGASGPAGPKGVNWRGNWAADTEYEQGDLVYLDTTGGGAAELVTYYCLVSHESLTGSPPAPGGNTNWWELGNAYLILDGSRPMTGDLDMDTHEIDNIQNAHFSGAQGDGDIDGVRDISFSSDIGEGVVDQPRVIHMAGDKADDEAKVDGLERVVFNNEPTASSIEVLSRVEYNTGVTAGSSYTAAAGKSSWDTVEDTLVVYVASGAGVVALAVGWSAALAIVAGS